MIYATSIATGFCIGLGLILANLLAHALRLGAIEFMRMTEAISALEAPG